MACPALTGELGPRQAQHIIMKEGQSPIALKKSLYSQRHGHKIGRWEYEASLPEFGFHSGGLCWTHMRSQLLAIFQSITPAVHASVNFPPD